MFPVSDAAQIKAPGIGDVDSGVVAAAGGTSIFDTGVVHTGYVTIYSTVDIFIVFAETSAALTAIGPDVDNAWPVAANTPTPFLVRAKDRFFAAAGSSGAGVISLYKSSPGQ